MLHQNIFCILIFIILVLKAIISKFFAKESEILHPINMDSLATKGNLLTLYASFFNMMS